MIIAGYLAAVFIGISLGLIGAGGSILTVPLLVYLFGIDAALATFYSLFIVGITSAVGSAGYFKNNLVDAGVAFIFGTPSIIAIFLTRKYLFPAIPGIIFSAGGYQATREILLMLLFAALMIAASYSMIRNNRHENAPLSNKNNASYPVIFLQGIATGLITGLVGAGGGFLIIPALVNILKLPIKKAIGTSLLIVSINSLAGFLFSLNHTPVQWSFLITIAILAITGIVIGSKLSLKIKAAKLKPAFGWFVLVMGIYIFIRETLLK